HYKTLGTKRGLEKLHKIILSNLNDLEVILNYNIKNNIHFYRLTSKLIPLATHESVVFNYKKLYKGPLEEIGKIINDNKMRVDSHPDQFCVINSAKEEVIESSLKILKYHKTIFDLMKINNPKIILHIGSGAGGKREGLKRFINVFEKLNKPLKNMIIIENDDKIYNIRNTLSLCNKLKVPMALDYHHHLCNNNGEKIEDFIEAIFNTWNNENLIPKVHFSSPKSKKEKRSHNDYIDVTEFIKFIERIKFINRDFDIMLEAKMKDIALFNLIRELKYKTDYKFIDETTFEV
ncbi:MAG: UV DNA damage repair endonuclease UvsE, partial [Bacilli bacterium]|nr:UV DNA damage repair endonuclease UvsE [Bacilli bacterium]